MNLGFLPLQLREIFHLEFLRWITRKMKAGSLALKGGVNLRFFFNSSRYSEDMDLDVSKIRVDALRNLVMKILKDPSFSLVLKPYGIDQVVGPDLLKAKQTETTQRFKIHLITSSGEDLFTKVEFSRRGFKGKVVVQHVSDQILRMYKALPILIPHYDAHSAIAQKVLALAMRHTVQARDVFDLYILSTQGADVSLLRQGVATEYLVQACGNVLNISYEQFRDTVLAYLTFEDQGSYRSSASWDEVKLKVISFMEARGRSDV